MGRIFWILSDREVEVLTLLAKGLSNEQIAKNLFVSTSTVKTHVNNIYRKLQISGTEKETATKRVKAALLYHQAKRKDTENEFVNQYNAVVKQNKELQNELTFYRKALKN